MSASGPSNKPHDYLQQAYEQLSSVSNLSPNKKLSTAQQDQLAKAINGVGQQLKQAYQAITANPPTAAESIKELTQDIKNIHRVIESISNTPTAAGTPLMELDTQLATIEKTFGGHIQPHLDAARATVDELRATYSSIQNEEERQTFLKDNIQSLRTALSLCAGIREIKEAVIDPQKIHETIDYVQEFMTSFDDEIFLNDAYIGYQNDRAIYSLLERLEKPLVTTKMIETSDVNWLADTFEGQLALLMRYFSGDELAVATTPRLFEITSTEEHQVRQLLTGWLMHHAAECGLIKAAPEWSTATPIDLLKYLPNPATETILGDRKTAQKLKACLANASREVDIEIFRKAATLAPTMEHAIIFRLAALLRRVQIGQKLTIGEMEYLNKSSYPQQESRIEFLINEIATQAQALPIIERFPSKEVERQALNEEVMKEIRHHMINWAKHPEIEPASSGTDESDEDSDSYTR